MRLTLIVIFGLIAISATSALSNFSSGQAQAPAHTTNTRINSTRINSTTINSTASTVTTKPNSAVSAGGSTATEAPATTVIDSHATTLDAARITARSSTGKADPFTPLDQVIKESDQKKAASKIPAFATGLNVPPPPPSVINPFGTHGASHPGQLNSGLDLGELPMPPDNAGINHKVELVGIVGDRAIFTIKDSLLRRRHHWPRTFTLAIGQSFENLKLTAIKDESVVIEEDGQTFSKQMPTIK